MTDREKKWSPYKWLLILFHSFSKKKKCFEIFRVNLPCLYSISRKRANFQILVNNENIINNILNKIISIANVLVRCGVPMFLFVFFSFSLSKLLIHNKRRRIESWSVNAKVQIKIRIKIHVPPPVIISDTNIEFELLLRERVICIDLVCSFIQIWFIDNVFFILFYANCIEFDLRKVVKWGDAVEVSYYFNQTCRNVYIFI